MSREITQDFLRYVFDYDDLNGVVTIRNNYSRNGRAQRGDVAGWVNAKGYRRVQIFDKTYFLHRLIYWYVYGYNPTGVVDHRDGDSSNNRLANLRHVTPQGNAQNRRKPSANNTSGYLGVRWHEDKQRWLAAITVDGKKRQLGSFKTPEAAYEAYVEAKRRLHPTCTI